MPVPSRKELATRLQSLLGSLLQEYAMEGKKNRKLSDKAAGQLAKAFRKNAKKQEAKKAAAQAGALKQPQPKQPQKTNLTSTL